MPWGGPIQETKDKNWTVTVHLREIGRIKKSLLSYHRPVCRKIAEETRYYRRPLFCESTDNRRRSIVS
jgi:hypothetical protein